MNENKSGARAARWQRLESTLLCALLALSSAAADDSAARSNSKLAHGFSYHRDEVASVPWSIHVVKIDRSQPNLELHTTLARGNAFGLALLSEQIRMLPADLGRPIAGITGDYYYKDRPYLGDPKGLQIIRGELVSGPCDWTCLWVDAAREMHMTNVQSQFEITWPTGQKTSFGLNEERASNAAVLYTAAVGNSTGTRGGRELILQRNGTNAWLPLRIGQTYSARVAEVRDRGDASLSGDTMVLSLGRQISFKVPKVSPGAVLQISTATFPDLAGATTAIGGGPPLVRGAKVIAREDDDNVRHPRSAVGWNKDFLFLVEVDGRQRNLSVGMTMRELANYMANLGCDEAMNLDGGGSAVCWVYGQVMNSPSEGRERGMANGLVVVQRKE